MNKHVLHLDMKNIFLEFNQMHVYSYLKQILYAQMKILSNNSGKTLRWYKGLFRQTNTMVTWTEIQSSPRCKGDN